MDLRFVPGFSLSEALDIIYEDEELGNQVDEIFVEPPEPNVDTDEDSGDEDSGNTFNLTGRQLRANAEIKLLNSQRVGVIDNNGTNELPDLPQTPDLLITDEPPIADPWIEEKIKFLKENKKNKVKPVWIEGDLESASHAFSTADYNQYKDKSCVDMFELFLDSDIIDYFVEETRNFAHFKTQPDPNITANEMKCFLGILILTGYCPLPSKRMYWDLNDDVKNYLVSNSMRRNRFLQIQRFIHFCDNTKIDNSDKAWKIRPLMDKIKANCLKNFVPTQQLSYDESMLKYFGRHGCKQFIRGKPIRFGFKMWCLNSSDGYIVNFDLYQGNNPRGNRDYELLFGTCATPLVLMLKELPVQNLRHEIYLDNLFCGPKLFSYLRHLGYGATGTVRENRIPQNCPLEDKKIFAKHTRGHYQHIIEKDTGILYVRWLDNAVVTMMSTASGVSPSGTVNRYSQKEKRRIVVNRPDCVSKYNKHMGGVDLMDECVSNYRIAVRSKKWYWPIVTWLIDVAINNAWMLYRKQHPHCSNLQFRREIAQVYLARYGTKPRGASTNPRNALVVNDIRYDRIDHWIQPCQRRRCQGDGCKSFGRTMCKKCDVGLCVPCFEVYHTR